MSWLLAFLGFAALIVLHELGHFAAAKAVGMRVERFALFFPPLIARKQRGETEYAIGAVPLGGYVKITGMNPAEQIPPEVADRAYFRQPVWKRIVVIAAGPVVNVVLAFLILWVFFSFEPVRDDDEPARPVVAAVNKGTPADGVLEKGDRILAVDGVRGNSEVLREQIGTHRCAGEQVAGCRASEAATLTIVRDGRELTRKVTPVYDAEEERPLIGFGFEPPPLEELGAGEAAAHSAETMWFVTRRTVEVVAGIFYDAEKRDQVGSIVGGYETTRRTFEYDAAQAIAILGLISLSLAVINLAPFLPLDGGHIFWALAEKVRGRAIPFRTMEQASVVGVMLVILLFLIGFTNDVERLRDGTFDRIR